MNSPLAFPPHSAGGPARNHPTIKIMSTTKNKLQVGPYLFFDGRCEEAIEFYRKALGAEVDMLMRFKDSPEPPQPGMHPPGSENKVMHANLRIGETQIMASDGRCGGKPHFEGFALSITVPTEAEADRLFAALADGGKVQMPLARTFFSPRFGMVADRFGVMWMIIVQPSGPPMK
jgi:PhnB protein